MIYHYTYEKFIEESKELIKNTKGIFNLCTYELLDLSYLKGFVKSTNLKQTESKANTNTITISNNDIITDIDNKEQPFQIENIEDSSSTSSYSFEFNIVFSETYQLPVLYFLIYNDLTGEITPFTTFTKDNPSQSDLIKFFEISKQNHPFTGRINEFLHLCKFNQLLNQLQSIENKEQQIHTILTFWLSIILQLFNIDIQTLLINKL